MNCGPVRDLVSKKAGGIVEYNTGSRLWPLSAPTHVCNCTHTGMNIEKNRKEELEGVFCDGNTLDHTAFYEQQQSEIASFSAQQSNLKRKEHERGHGSPGHSKVLLYLSSFNSSLFSARPNPGPGAW